MSVSHRNLLGLDAQKTLVEAQQAYEKEMNRLFPVGSTWLCFVGSAKGYPVEIVWNDFDGIQVKHSAGGKEVVRRVPWASLKEMPAVKP